MKSLIYLLGLFYMCTYPLSSTNLNFIDPTDPRLNQPAKEVSLRELRSVDCQNLIMAMLELAGYEADPSQTQKKSRLVGLAAPQVGVMKRIVVIDTRYEAYDSKMGRYEENCGKLAKTGFEVLINPEIVWSSEEKDSIPQGCFSVPSHLMGLVKRPSAVKVKALNADGKKIEKHYQGYPAHIVQHEIDHLDGIRFPERLSSCTDLHLLNKAQIEEYRKNWKQWPNHGSEETLNQLKAGDYRQVVK